MGTVETSDDYESCFRLLISFAYCCKKPSTVKMSEAEAQDAFIIFDEAYEGNDVDAFYLGDILRALGCNVTNAAVEAAGGATELGQKRIAFADFKPILAAVKADTSSTEVKEDYVEGLKVFDKEGTGKVPLPEVENNEAAKLCELLGIVADEEDNISYMDFIDKLLACQLNVSALQTKQKNIFDHEIKIEQRLGKTMEERKKKNVRTNCFRMNFKLNSEWDSLDSLFCVKF